MGLARSSGKVIVARFVPVVYHPAAPDGEIGEVGATANIKRITRSAKMPFLTAASTCATLLTFTAEPMRVLFAAIVSSAILFVASSAPSGGKAPASPGVATIFGFRNAAPETAAETQFLSVPDSKLAEEHLRILTKSPHMAGTIEDKATADYVAEKCREAGLYTEFV